MLFLVLAIISSALVSITMRLSESYIKNNMGMFTANYAVCLILARIFMGKAGFFELASESGTAGMAGAAGLGLFSGALYLINFVFLQVSMRYNGIMLSSMFMKLGVLVPTLMAILIFRERPEVFQIAGIALAVCAIILVNLEKGPMETSPSAGQRDSGRNKKIWLIILLLISGLTDSMANIYDKTGAAEWKEHYLFYTFLAALLFACFMAVRGMKKVGLTDVLFGILIGVPNYFSARFLLLALGSVPAVITYPVYSVATIVVISIVSVVFFHEKMGKRKLAALGLVMLALGMLNL